MKKRGGRGRNGMRGGSRVLQGVLLLRLTLLMTSRDEREVVVVAVMSTVVRSEVDEGEKASARVGEARAGVAAGRRRDATGGSS